jgi:hypothetical protein
VPSPTQVDPATQLKGLKIVAAIMTFSGLVIGIGMPALFTKLGIRVYTTAWGFDVMWLICLAVMLCDFGLAWYFWRRAGALERTMLGLPPRGT